MALSLALSVGRKSDLFETFRSDCSPTFTPTVVPFCTELSFLSQIQLAKSGSVDRDSSVGMATVLWTVRSGDRITVGARFSALVQFAPRAYPASCTMGTGSFLWGVKR